MEAGQSGGLFGAAYEEALRRAEEAAREALRLVEQHADLDWQEAAYEAGRTIAGCKRELIANELTIPPMPSTLKPMPDQALPDIPA